MAQPHVLLTVRDKRGKLLEAVQESPQVWHRSNNCNNCSHAQNAFGHHTACAALAGVRCTLSVAAHACLAAATVPAVALLQC